MQRSCEVAKGPGPREPDSTDSYGGQQKLRNRVAGETPARRVMGKSR